MSERIKIFNEYYHTAFWGNKTGSSGPNSDPALTPILRQNLAALLDTYQIKSLVDAGCGDVNLFKHIDIAHIDYIGIECVEALTQHNQRTFSDQKNMSFKTGDITSIALPKADMIFCRDVVHYLPNNLIFQFLEQVIASGSTYLCITHNTHSALSANSETEIGIFRPVNLTQNPFYFSPIMTIKEDTFAKEMALFAVSDITVS